MGSWAEKCEDIRGLQAHLDAIDLMNVVEVTAGRGVLRTQWDVRNLISCVRDSITVLCSCSPHAGAVYLVHRAVYMEIFC